MIVRNQGALKWSVQVNGKLMLSNQTTFGGITDMRSFLRYVWDCASDADTKSTIKLERIEADATQVLLLSNEWRGESS